MSRHSWRISGRMRFAFCFTGLVAVLSVVAACSSTSGGQVASGGGDVKHQSASTGGLRAYQELKLKNGLRVLLLEDSSLPYLSLQMLIQTGSASDPDGSAGLSSLVAELLQQGTQKRDAQKLAEDLARIGASFGTSVNEDFTSVSMSGLSLYGDEFIKNFVELLTQPRFADAEITRLKKQRLAQMARRLDSPAQVADLAAQRVLYRSHPYALPASGLSATVEKITKKQVIQHYLRYYRPNNSILAVVGQFTPEFAKRLTQQLESWSARDVKPMLVTEPTDLPGPRIFVVEKPGLTQAQVRFIRLGIRRADENFIPLRVANTILGGAFASRLNNRVRKELGLTYNINSGFDARLQRGPFEIETFTKVESIGPVVRETLAIWRQLHAQGIRSEELERARGYLRGVFPQAIETGEKLAFNLLLLRHYGIPDTYLRNYVRDLERLRVSDVNEAIKKVMVPENWAVVIHAPAGSAKGLEDLGPIESISLSSLK
jgi:zinc protease